MNPLSSRQISAGVKSDKPQYKKKEESESGGLIYRYDEKHLEKRKDLKDKKIKKLEKGIKEVRKKYESDLKSDDLLTQAVACVVCLIDESAARVGNEDSASGETASGSKTYGATTLLKKHLSFSGGKARFKFPGKDNVKQDIFIENKDAIKVLKDLIKDKKDNDFIFEVDGKKIWDRRINRYLAPLDISAKDLRGFRANHIMRDKLKHMDFEDALEETAKIVGHEPGTLRNQYLESSLVEKYEGKKKSFHVIRSLSKRANEFFDEMGFGLDTELGDWFEKSPIFRHYDGYEFDIHDVSKSEAEQCISSNPLDFFYKGLHKEHKDLVPLALRAVIKQRAKFFFVFDYHKRDEQEFRDLIIEAAQALSQQDPRAFFYYNLHKQYPELGRGAVVQLIDTNPDSFFDLGLGNEYRDLVDIANAARNIKDPNKIEIENTDSQISLARVLSKRAELSPEDLEWVNSIKNVTVPAATTPTTGGVKINNLILAAWQTLLPFLPKGSMITSGERTADDQKRILEHYWQKATGTPIPANLKTNDSVWFQVSKILKDDYGYIVGPPKTDDPYSHLNGRAFDVSGADLNKIADIAVRVSNNPSLPVKFRKPIIERQNNCVHLGIESAEYNPEAIKLALKNGLSATASYTGLSKRAADEPTITLTEKEERIKKQRKQYWEHQFSPTRWLDYGAIPFWKYPKSSEKPALSKRAEVNDKAGVFTVLPKKIGKQFNSLGDHDNSDPHITVLFVSKIPKKDRKLFEETVRDVLADWKPFEAKLDDKVTYFPASKNSDGCKIAKMGVVSKELHRLHRELKKAVAAAGIKIDDTFPDYKPHVTLEYMEKGKTKYEDEIPSGDWDIDCVEIWGIGKNRKIKFGEKSLSKRAISKSFSDKDLIELYRFMYLRNALERRGDPESQGFINYLDQSMSDKLNSIFSVLSMVFKDWLSYHRKQFGDLNNEKEFTDMVEWQATNVMEHDKETDESKLSTYVAKSYNDVVGWKNTFNTINKIYEEISAGPKPDMNTNFALISRAIGVAHTNGTMLDYISTTVDDPENRITTELLSKLTSGEHEYAQEWNRELRRLSRTTSTSLSKLSCNRITTQIY